MVASTEQIKGAEVPEYNPPSNERKLVVFLQSWLFTVLLFAGIFVGYHYFSQLIFEDPGMIGISFKIGLILFLFVSVTFGTVLAVEMTQWRLGNETSYYLDARNSKIVPVEMLDEDLDWIIEQVDRNNTDVYTELKRCIDTTRTMIEDESR